MDLADMWINTINIPPSRDWVWFYFHSRRYNSAEPRPLHPQSWLGLPTRRNDLKTDMFTFAITIGPYHEEVGGPSFGFQVALHLLVVLYIDSTGFKYWGYRNLRLERK